MFLHIPVQIEKDYWWTFTECSGDVYEVGEVYDGRVDYVRINIFFSV